MSNDMNAVTEQIGNVARATQTLVSNDQSYLDAADQTRMRQRHIHHIADRLRAGELRTESGDVDVLALLYELDVINARCPATSSTFAIAKTESVRLFSIVQAETAQLYEMVEKMRDLAGATVDSAITGDSPY